MTIRAFEFTNSDDADVLERFLVAVGAPGLAVVLFSDLLTAVLFISMAVTVTGFLGYCEMYRALREINDRVLAIDDGEFDVDFGVDRPDEIGETYGALERTARSLGDTIAEAREARTEAETAREEALDALEEIAANVESADRSIQEISDVAGQISDEADGVSTATREQTDSLAAVSDNAASLAERANELRDRLDAFTVGETDPEPGAVARTRDGDAAERNRGDGDARGTGAGPARLAPDGR